MSGEQLKVLDCGVMNTEVRAMLEQVDETVLNTGLPPSTVNVKTSTAEEVRASESLWKDRI